MCGGGIPIVSDVVDAVSDVFDKADNWTEGAGDLLADIDPGPALGDAGEWIDNSVIQPMKEDPLAAVATIAAVSTGNSWALPFIAGTATAARGGDLGDIALSAGVGWVAGQAAPYVSSAMPGVSSIAGKIATGAATGAVIGAGSGATVAAVKGKSVGDYALRGGIGGGVAGGVAAGVNAGYSAIKSELGIGNTYAPDIKADSEFIAAQAESARAAGAGEQQIADILQREGVQSFTAQDVAGLTASGVGENAVAQNIAASYQPMETYTVPKTPENIFEKTGKKLVADTAKKAILEQIYQPQPMQLQPIARRRGSLTGGDTASANYTETSDDSGILTPATTVGTSKYELRKFVNDSGNTTLVSFKDDKPQTPIPTGYREVEVVGAAKGGLIDSIPSTTMVKYSKKPLLAKRKKEIKTAKKGLASR